jgi:hypothetical protein
MFASNVKKKVVMQEQKDVNSKQGYLVQVLDCAEE